MQIQQSISAMCVDDMTILYVLLFVQAYDKTLRYTFSRRRTYPRGPGTAQ